MRVFTASASEHREHDRDFVAYGGERMVVHALGWCLREVEVPCQQFLQHELKGVDLSIGVNELVEGAEKLIQGGVSKLAKRGCGQEKKG